MSENTENSERKKWVLPEAYQTNNENSGNTPVLKHPLPPNVFTRKGGGALDISTDFFFNCFHSLLIFTRVCMCGWGGA